MTKPNTGKQHWRSQNDINLIQAVAQEVLKGSLGSLMADSY